MYGDNRRRTLEGLGVILILIFFTLIIVTLVKVNRLEKDLASRSESSPIEDFLKDPSPESGEITQEKLPSSKGEVITPFYSALTYWQNHKEEQKESRKMTEQLFSQNWSFLDELGLTLEETSTNLLYHLTWVEEKQKIVLFSLVPQDDESWVLRSLGGEEKSFSQVNLGTRTFIKKESQKEKVTHAQKAEWNTLFLKIVNTSEYKELLKQKKCTSQEKREGELLKGLTLLTEEGRVVLRGYGKEGQLWIDDEPYEADIEGFSKIFLLSFKECDSRPMADIRMAENLDLIRSTFQSRKFIEYLEEEGLYPKGDIRSDEDFSYLDLVDQQGERQASFGVKRSTGQIYMVDQDDVPLVALDTLALEEGDLLEEQDLNYTGGGDSFSLLLVGYHNKSTDTMILANVNRETEDITLISIPRDLWWEGQKINSYYFGNSREELLEVISQITGVQVDYYLTIDMYAFIDVVNSMGGVDITLKREVNDPTYKVIREDGTEGVLFYPPGEYHLNGVEALRLARSRHGSSDFERSLLQQEILRSLKSQLGLLTLKDLGTLNRFFKIALKNVDTNMSLPFIVKNLSGSRDYIIDSGHGLNSEETTYATYSNYLSLSEKEENEARGNSEFDRGQWILLPIHNNWNLIQRRVQAILEG